MDESILFIVYFCNIDCGGGVLLVVLGYEDDMLAALVDCHEHWIY